MKEKEVVVLEVSALPFTVGEARGDILETLYAALKGREDELRREIRRCKQMKNYVEAKGLEGLLAETIAVTDAVDAAMKDDVRKGWWDESGQYLRELDSREN
jgi:hypothetical protein